VQFSLFLRLCECSDANRHHEHKGDAHAVSRAHDALGRRRSPLKWRRQHSSLHNQLSESCAPGLMNSSPDEVPGRRQRMPFHVTGLPRPTDQIYLFGTREERMPFDGGLALDVPKQLPRLVGEFEQDTERQSNPGSVISSMVSPPSPYRRRRRGASPGLGHSSPRNSAGASDPAPESIVGCSIKFNMQHDADQ
jgi:hypothetical protein